MFKNQYTVSFFPTLKPCDVKWNELHIYLGEKTEYTSNKKCLIIGKAVSSVHSGKTQKDIAEDLQQIDSNIEAIEYFNTIAGRYVVFIKIEDDILFFTDACGFKRGLFFNDGIYKFITSSEKFAAFLFDINLYIDEDTRTLVEQAKYKRQESPWFGMSSYDTRFKFVIPNHYLDCTQFKLFRMAAPSSSESIYDPANMLMTTLSNFSCKYKLIQPITAGIDSRVLLAASKLIKSKVIYYVFGEKDSLHEDVRISKQLSDINNNQLNIFTCNEANVDFKKSLMEEVFLARDLPKTNNIYYHFKHTSNEYININGNGAEVYRSYYGISNKSLGPNSLAQLEGVSEWPLLKKGIRDWYIETGAVSYAKENGISVSDLFYWEQRVAIWGSMYPLEQDYAIDEVSPFSNRMLLFKMLSESSHDRVGPQFNSSRRIIQKLKPNLLNVPINPDSTSYGILGLMKKYTLIRLALKFIKNKLLC
jgi:hypothetical protein